MAMFHGRAGKVAWEGGSGNTFSDVEFVTSWTFDATADVAETTAMSDANYWKSYLAGFKDWTATVEYNPQGAVTPVPGLSNSDLGVDKSDASLQLWFTQTEGDGMIIGTGTMTGFSVNEPADGIVTVTANFQGVGDAHWSDAAP